MGAFKQSMLEEMYAENCRQEKKEQEKFLLEDIIESQHEEDLIELSIQDQMEEDSEQEQLEEEYECKLTGEFYFRTRIVTIAPSLMAKAKTLK
jgi:hypothetical protein